MTSNWQELLEQISKDGGDAHFKKQDTKALSDAHVRLTQVVMDIAIEVKRLAFKVEKLTQAAHLQSKINAAQTAIDDGYDKRLGLVQDPNALEVVL